MLMLRSRNGNLLSARGGRFGPFTTRACDWRANNLLEFSIQSPQSHGATAKTFNTDRRVSCVTKLFHIMKVCNLYNVYVATLNITTPLQHLPSLES
jgi:hypothetical protein